jgi:hypothetical protein
MTEIEEGVDTPRRMDAKRRKVRRYLAVGSFAYLVIQSAAICSFLILSDERQAIMAAFQGLTPMVIATNTMLVSIVLGYLGVSLTEKITTGGK